jgi:hypothetical protein
VGPLLRRAAAIVVTLCVAVIGVSWLTGAVAQARHLSRLRIGTAAEEIGHLNAQRRENGIPDGLRNVSGLSLGCDQYENLYVARPGQNPHEELPGQPGYTPLGNLAANLSDLANGVGALPLWGDHAIDNAWANAPLHLVSLFNPVARYAWFGAGPFGACMGTAPDNPLQSHARGRLVSPRFFSLPGNGVGDVWPVQVVNDLPFAPQEAVHIPAGRPTGPNIILFPEGLQVRIDRAQLRSADGRGVALRVVTPATPTPPYPSGWRAVKYMGEEVGDVWFVIPTRPLRGATHYRLTALWSDAAGRRYTQRVRFKTLARSPARPALRSPPRY